MGGDEFALLTLSIIHILCTGGGIRHRRAAGDHIQRVAQNIAEHDAEHPVSYTHLDVYKRQAQHMAEQPDVEQRVLQRGAVDTEQVHGCPPVRPLVEEQHQK